MFFLFIRQKILMMRNSFTLRGLAKRLPFIALGAGFWFLLFFGTCKGLSFLSGIGTFGELLSERLLSVVLFVIAVFLMLSTIVASLSTFYLSRDIPFLLSNPLETRDIVRLKTFESVLLSSWTVVLFTEPVFLAYGASYHAAALYYAASFLAFLLLVLTAVGIGMTLAHLLAKFFPVRRSREILLGLGLVLFLFFYFAIKSNLPAGYGHPEDFLKAFALFKTDAPFLPGFWVMKTILPSLKGQTPDVFYMILLVFSGAFFIFAAQIAGRCFYISNVEKIRPSDDIRAPLSERSYPRPGSALLFKDLRIFLRDAGQWPQVFIICALVMVYVYNFKSAPLKEIMTMSPFAREILVIANLFMAGLVLTAMAARFLFTSVSFEGQAFWVVRSAPLSLRKFLWSKFLYGCIPLTGVVLFLVSLTNYILKISGPLLLLSEATAFFLSLSVSGLAAGMGATFPKFEYENIASVSVGMGALSFMLIAFALITATLSAGAWGYYLYATGIKAGGAHTAEGIRLAICLSVIFLMNSVAFYLPMRTGIKRLETMQS